MNSKVVIRVVIADDHDLFRDGMRAVLTTGAGIEVVGEASDGAGALATTLAERPDVLMLDVEMPGVPVLSTITRVLAEAPDTRIVIVTMHRDRVLASHLLAAGASAFISKSATSSELIAAVRQTAPAVSARAETRRASSESVLSHREREVLKLIGDGLPNQAISQQLSISVGTVKRHNTHIFAKLGAASRTDAVRRARTLGEFADARP
ncbi:response regulator transcription factor [Agromyces laixinhei]|uniref:response regulator transcription factor n=1 Tax=Agromyces laixinhei TaxID=2585717 RepID=UPI001116FDF5|nr:response regulator transcription factor [Agromyces laixinhei]